MDAGANFIIFCALRNYFLEQIAHQHKAQK